MNFEIGISGFMAAQKSLDVIGNNIANSATEGYHRQKVELAARSDVYSDGVMVGQGVDIDGVIRMVNNFLDSEIVKQESTMTQITRELETLVMMESAFGEMSSDSLSSALGGFFNSMYDLTEDPEDKVLLGNVVSAAETMVSQLRNLGTSLSKTQDQLYIEANNTIDEVNSLTSEIANLNKTIKDMVIRGGDPNNITDQRDQLLTDLGRLVGITALPRDYGTVDVTIGGTTVVMGSQSADMKVGLADQDGGKVLYISPVSKDEPFTGLSGGRLGGIFKLRNESLQDLADQMDNLARTIITETNELHVQGIGALGSFTELQGWGVTENLSEFDLPISDGDIFVRVTHDDGSITRHSISVNAATDTLTDIVGRFDAIQGLSCTATGGKIQIQADTGDAGQSFDFLPGVMPEPPAAGADNTLTVPAPDIDLSGTFTGDGNYTYTFTVATIPAGGTGTIGTGDLKINITRDTIPPIAPEAVKEISVGSGYVTGKLIDIEDGINISFGTGELTDGEMFNTTVLGDSDTSGFLAAAGVNCFFAGMGASSIEVTEHVSNPMTGGGHIAFSRSAEMTDSANILKIADIGETSFTDLGNLTIKQYYNGIVNDLGSEVSLSQTRQENSQSIWRSLSQQRDAASGVDMNDEAAKMLVFERMFQAMAKYINTISGALDTLMSIMR